MKRLAASVVGLLVLLPLALAQGGVLRCKAEGLYLCCPDCDKSAQEALAKVGGVSEVVCDRTTKSVAFKARNQKAADDAVSALIDAGFWFQVSEGDKKYPVTSKDARVSDNPLVVRNVHVCCDGCEKAIQALFKDAKVTFAGKGPVKDVTFAGKEFDSERVMEALHGAGFHGVVVGTKK